MTEVYRCRDCPPGTPPITDHVYRVQRREKILGQAGAVKGKVVAVNAVADWDIYCAKHYEARKERGEL